MIGDETADRAGGQDILARDAMSSVAPPSQSAVPQFALDAANRQAARVADVLAGAAQSIDDLVAGVDLPLPDAVTGFAATASEKLRALADRANEDEAGRLIEGLQRSAASHPVATAGIGAALGAALGFALSQLGRGRPADRGEAVSDD